MTLNEQSIDFNRYNTALLKGGLLFDEMVILLNNWVPNEPIPDFIQRVISNDLLAKATESRVKDIITTVFSRRFLKPDDRPARILQIIINTHLPIQVLREFLYLYSCRSNRLIYDYSKEFFWPKIGEGRMLFDRNDIIAFIAEKENIGYLPNHWSEEVRNRLSQFMYGILRDTGFLSQPKQGKYQVIPYEVSDIFLSLLIRDLHELEVPDGLILEHPDWGLYGISKGNLLSKISDLSNHSGYIMQRAGSVVNFTWSIQSMEEMMHVI